MRLLTFRGVQCKLPVCSRSTQVVHTTTALTLLQITSALKGLELNFASASDSLVDQHLVLRYRRARLEKLRSIAGFDFNGWSTLHRWILANFYSFSCFNDADLAAAPVFADTPQEPFILNLLIVLGNHQKTTEKNTRCERLEAKTS